MQVPEVLPVKPLEFSDFSGGITENILQGDPRRYASADNMFITVDKKLEERPGFIIDGEESAFITGSEGKRINGYFLQLNDTELLPQVARNIYYKAPVTSVWTPIVGIAGNNTLSGGDVNSQTTTAEFQRQIYLATDGTLADDGVLPSKIYKNESNVWTAKTVGLPRSWVLGNYTDQSLLAKCITNANALRTSMINHFLDAKYNAFTVPTAYETTSGDLHLNIDRWGLQYFIFQSFGVTDPTPNPLPTPQAAATNEAELLALVGNLGQAYIHHVINDAMKNSWGTHPLAISVTDPQVPPSYHQDPPVWAYAGGNSNFPLYKTKGPASPLEAGGATPDELEEAAAILDDLWQKWNWHRLSLNTHDRLNNYATINRYMPVGTKIGDIQIGGESSPTITTDFGDLYAYANNLRALYNSHVTNATGIGGGGTILHKQRDNAIYNMQLECTLPTCTDLDSMYLLIWWIRSLYQLHNYDANIPYFRDVLLTSSLGSPNLTAMTFQDNGAPSSGIDNFFLGANPIQNFAFWNPILNTEYRPTIYLTARILSSGAGTATIDHNSRIAWGPGAEFQIAASQYHGSYTYASGTLDNLDLYPSTSAESSSSALAVDVRTYGNSIESWLALANDFFFSFANHLKQIQLHGGSNTVNIASDYTVFVGTAPNAPFYIPAISEVAYAFFFSDEYTVEPNGIDYLVQGNPVFSPSTEVAISYPVGEEIPNILYPDFYPAKPATVQRGTTLTNLPILTNDASTNYDTGNIKLNIYRTTDGGNTFFKLAEVPNGTTSYLDIINDTIANPGDTALFTRQPIYTSGGVVGFDQPPICKYTHILNGYTYWGGITDAGQFFPNRIRQSIQFAPDAAPENFFDDLDDEIVGISSTRNNALAFCKTGIYRMGGAFNTLGQGALTHENIGDTLGALNAKSIVRTEIGVFFAGTDGFYYTDGYQVIPLTLELKKTYALLTQSDDQKRAIYGGYDKSSRRVWWSMREGSTNSENSVVYTFYLEYGIKPSGTFTLIRNGLNFQPSSLVFKDGVAYIGDGRGYLLKMNSDTKWDVEIDQDIVPGAWNHIHIPYDFKSVAIDMGSIFNRKWLTKTHLVGKNTGNMAIQPYLIRDVNEYNQGAVPLAPINYTQNVVWGTPSCTWGDPLAVWKTDGKMDVWRRFPARNLRSDFMQVQFKPADLCVYASSVLYPQFAWVMIDKTGWGVPGQAIAILNQPTGYTDLEFFNDVPGYRMKLAIDGYVNEYEIISFFSDHSMLILSDPDDVLTDMLTPPGVEWEIWGIKKEQRLSITSFVIHFAYLGDKNQNYPGAKSNDGPGNAGQNP